MQRLERAIRISGLGHLTTHEKGAPSLQQNRFESEEANRCFNNTSQEGWTRARLDSVWVT